MTDAMWAIAMIHDNIVDNEIISFFTPSHETWSLWACVGYLSHSL